MKKYLVILVLGFILAGCTSTGVGGGFGAAGGSNGVGFGLGTGIRF